jgi:pimeloyl-ACP methyl ester carboxylesterase
MKGVCKGLLVSCILLGYPLFTVCQQAVAPQLEPQFSYAHRMEIAYNDHKGFALDPSIELLARELNKQLNQSILFDPTFLYKAPRVRDYHLRPKPTPELIGTMYDVTTQDGVRLGSTLFDRGSDTLLVIGAGFTNEREVMSPFVAMFPDYDVVIFDFRGHGYRPFSITDTETWPLSLTKVGFGIDGSLVTFGLNEDKDVFAVVDGFKALKQCHYGKPYKNVFGLGVCYGALIFLKTLSVYPGIFDKLVLDGCWLSLPLYIDKVTADLKTLCNPQTGGWKEGHWLYSKQWFKNAVAYLGRKLLNLNTDITLLDYAPKIKNASVMLFYGKDDYMVKRDEFEQLWNALSGVEKTAIITSNPHVRNHLKQKELYKMMCDLYFQLPQEAFITCLRDPQAAVDFFSRRLARVCLSQENKALQENKTPLAA